MGLNDTNDLEISSLCCVHVEIVTISTETMGDLKKKPNSNHTGTVAEALHDAYYLFFS